MAPVYKVAIIQLHPEPLRIERNHQKAAEYIATAASLGAHLAVLPEYHLTSWVPEDPQFIPLCGQWRTYLDRYRALAQKHHICIVPGTLVEHHQDASTDEGNLINVAYFIGDTGEVLGSYQKKNLWHPEREHLTSSTHDPHTVIHTPLGPVGLLICWDLAFPEAFRELIAAGAKMIIIPSFWNLTDCTPAGLALNPLAESLFVTSALTARAFENTCAIIFVNTGAPTPASSSSSSPTTSPISIPMGLSRAILPFIGPLSTIPPPNISPPPPHLSLSETKDSSAEGMSVVALDMAVVEEAERNYGVRADLAGDGWHYEYRHGKADGDGDGDGDEDGEGEEKG